ncbi:MAG: response regulator [Anaerolineae bacterium]|nr:response regulator [Anaerolineae bacterium]
MSQILIIEDNEQNARMAAKLLRHVGHEVVVAEDGETGMTALLETAPDLVLVDLGLPDIDGQTIVAMLRQHPSLAQTAVVAFTAWPADKAQEMAKAYGCDGVITKPIDTRAFAAQVANNLKPRES